MSKVPSHPDTIANHISHETTGNAAAEVGQLETPNDQKGARDADDQHDSDDEDGGVLISENTKVTAVSVKLQPGTE